ncbi:heat-inducible transcription repressor HrcA [bacterium]|nr:heat-inducible transcription repressor HrcA [bacterium]
MFSSLINKRKKRILHLVVHNYIQTARPIGSNVICKNYGLKISSATVRNILADLEKEGYLTHPYTSAGRLPTDKGYRFYVDSLEENNQLTVKEEMLLAARYKINNYELKEMLWQLSHLLSLVSHYTGFVFSVSQEKVIFKHLKLIHLSNKKILAVFITQAGLIKHKVICLRSTITIKNLKRMCNILNDEMVGFTVKEVRNKILDKIKKEKIAYKEFLELGKELNEQIFKIKEELYLEGISNILSFTNNHQRVESVFNILQERKMLSYLLEEKFDKKENVKVFIGNENSYPQMNDWSIVSAVYKTGDYPIGLLGIVGPKRMEYSRIIAEVDYISRMANKLLEQGEEE